VGEDVPVLQPDERRPVALRILLHLPAIIGKAGRDRAAARRPDLFLQPIAEGVVGVRRLHQQGAAIGGPLLDTDELVALIVGVGPGLGAGPLALLGLVALVVVGVGPGAVGRQLIAAASRVAGHGPVAVGIVTVIARAIAGQLVGSIVAERRRAAVERLGQ